MPLSDDEHCNWQQQLDELLALTSIYQEDFQLVAVEGVAGQELHGSSRDGAVPSGISVEDLAQCEPPESAWQLDCCIAVQIEPPAGRLLLQLPQPPANGAAAGGSGSDAARGQAPAEAGAVAADGSLQGPGSGGGSGEVSSSSSSSSAGGFSVRYLPPITLRLRLHPAYPSHSPPQLLGLSALWLSPAQAALAAQQLQQLWEEQGPGLPVCFTWAYWLQSSALQHFGAAEVLVLQGSEGEAAAAAAVEKAGAGSSALGGAAGGSSSRGSSGGLGQLQEEEEQEEGAEGPDQVLLKLLRYDAAREHQEFQRSMHTCSICFEEQPGTSFVRLECRHHYCAGCLQEQCRIHVREGSLELLKCPEPKCGAALSPQVLQRVLEPQEFGRWESLTLQKTLDRMADACYCPRCSTVSLEDADSCAQCPKCLFVFCSLCNESWHPGTQCVSAETRLAMLQRKMAGLGAMSVQELRRREQEMLSLAAIEGMSKKCPSCNMAVQKAEGCNKMTCGNCGSFFCYKCGKQITGYEHYKTGQCILFDEAEILRWEAQWEDQVARVAMAEARNEFFGAQQLAQRGPGQRLRACHCPQCGQQNFKLGNNNHMNCWACTSHFCYMCRQVLRGKGGTHFGPKGCKQHTSD